jgi:hypothetical protein
VAEIFHRPETLGLHVQEAVVIAALLIQPAILFIFQKKVTLPAWLTAAVMVIGVDLVAVVADAVSEISTVANDVGDTEIMFDTAPSPAALTARIMME